MLQDYSCAALGAEEAPETGTPCQAHQSQVPLHPLDMVLARGNARSELWNRRRTRFVKPTQCCGFTNTWLGAIS